MPPQARHIARRLSRWDSNPNHARSTTTGGATFNTLLGIPDASALDVASLWAPRRRDDELRVPIGITATGDPLYFDLKDEAEGGMGPHGLMIGMTGSGKSQTLMSILLSLLTTHSADRLIVIYADFKGEAGRRHLPQLPAGRRGHLQHGREALAGRPVRRHAARRGRSPRTAAQGDRQPGAGQRVQLGDRVRERHRGRP